MNICSSGESRYTVISANGSCCNKMPSTVRGGLACHWHCQLTTPQLWPWQLPCTCHNHLISIVVTPIVCNQTYAGLLRIKTALDYVDPLSAHHKAPPWSRKPPKACSPPDMQWEGVHSFCYCNNGLARNCMADRCDACHGEGVTAW